MKKIRHQNENDNNYDIYDLNLKDKIGKNTGVNKDEIKKRRFINFIFFRRYR